MPVQNMRHWVWKILCRKSYRPKKRLKKLKICCIPLDTLVSGSPIIQNGKLIGAVTHVLVNDPTRGYGIFAENMLETAQLVSEQQLKEAS